MDSQLIQVGTHYIYPQYCMCTMDFTDQNGGLTIPPATGNEKAYVYGGIGWKANGAIIVVPAGATLQYRAYYAPGCVYGPVISVPVSTLCSNPIAVYHLERPPTIRPGTITTGRSTMMPRM